MTGKILCIIIIIMKCINNTKMMDEQWILFTLLLAK